MTGETITRLRATSTTQDRYGNDEPDWADPDSEPIAGCAVAPRTAPEDTDAGREGVIIGLTVYAPPGADIRPTDRVVCRGDLYVVDGPVGLWTSPFSNVAAGNEIQLKRVEG